jgi:drug/metabolite transporter (DMT)-like permease
MEWFLFAILCAFFSSAAAITQKKTLNIEHPMEFSTVLAIFNMVLALPFFFLIDFSLLKFVPLFILFLISMISSVAFLFIAKALKHMDVSVCSPMLVMGPGITAIFAMFFLGERLSFLQISGIGFMIVGGYLLQLKPHYSFRDPIKFFMDSKFIHYIFFALVLYSICAICDRLLLHKYSMQIEAYVGFVHVFIAFVFLFMLSFCYDGFKGVKHGIKNAGWWIFAIALFTISYRYFQAKAVAVAYVALVVAIKRSSALITTIVGGELFNEKNLFRKFFSASIMFLGLVFVIL